MLDGMVASLVDLVWRRLGCDEVLNLLSQQLKSSLRKFFASP